MKQKLINKRKIAKIAYIILAICFIAALFLGMTSCNRKQIKAIKESLVSQTSEKSKDSSFTKDSTSKDLIVIRDTVYQPGDTLITTFTIECDSLTNKPKDFSFTSGSKSHNTKTESKDGKFTSQSNCSGLMTVIEKWKESYYKLEQRYNKQSDSIKHDVSWKKSESQIKLIYKIPKWIFYLLAASVALNLWYNREYVTRFIKLIVNTVI